jgi:nucleotide-binding universal stress UspA family protein
MACRSIAKKGTALAKDRAEDVMLAIKNLLVATDFSECSDAALTYARALAGTFGARLHVLHVVEFAGAADVMGIGGYSTALPNLYRELEDSAHQQLDGLISESDRRLLGAKVLLSTGEMPAHAIVEYAKAESIDLIVVGTHGRRGLAHLVMGSVAERVVRTAPCPVLTVRHPEREFVVAHASSEPATAGV